jgi:16S rRNA (uracil1498-N3)-methyltransferase
MHLFYYSGIRDSVFTLDNIESAHCAKVLRLSAGDIIYLTDGEGKLYRATIVSPDKKACVARIQEVINVPRERGYQLQIAIAPTRNIERFEWFLEKATEIGADRIIPLLCNNSERRIIKEERLKKVMVSAMKQSLKAWLPDITPLTSFANLVRQEIHGSKFIATGSEPAGNHLGKLYERGSDVLIMIGPEGDFHPDEMHLARQNGFIPVSLGTGRLRTETAGLVACQTINFMNY